MCLQGADGHRSPGNLELFVPVVPHFHRATCTRALLFKVYLRDLQLVSSKAAFPLSEVKEGRAMVAEMLGGVVCPAGWELPLSPCVAWSSRAHKSVTGGRLVSTPANRNALAQGDKHSVSTHCSRGSVLRLYRER